MSISNSNDKMSYLSWEIIVAITLIKRGLISIQKEIVTADLNHATSLLISSGLERLIKSTLCVVLLNDQGNYSERPYNLSGRNGHDLNLLLERLVSTCKDKKRASKFVAVQSDLELLYPKSVIRKIINHFSEFAQGGRYYSLDMALKGNSKYRDPYIEWADIGKLIYKTRIEPKLKNPEDYEKFELDHVYKELIIILELVTRALVRIIALSCHMILEKLPPFCSDFLFLEDRKLGETNYEYKDL